MGLNTQSLLLGGSTVEKTFIVYHHKSVTRKTLNRFTGRQIPEGTTRITDEKDSSPVPPTPSSVSSPTHMPGSCRMLQK